tara:strand:+ start:221 stop:400 length:180 start_codon:yes stop_codon:yes gene_type:complete
MDWKYMQGMIFDLFPEAEIAEDNDGQIIIYTGMTTINSDGEVGPIECEGKDENNLPPAR